MAPDDVTETVPVQFRVRRDLLEQFKQVVADEERTVSADLRRYMRRRVDESEKQNGRPATAARP